MYVPSKWKIDDHHHIKKLMKQFSFATVVTPDLNASLLPLVYDEQRHCLIGHFARSNPHSKVTAGTKAVAIFNGPHHYISPTWYNATPAVPTWNYVSVHAHGELTLLNEAQTIEGLKQLIAQYEPELLTTKTSVITPEYQEKLLHGIVGFSIAIDDIQAKAKLGQHRKESEQQGVLNQLLALNTAESLALVNVMKTLNIAV